MRSHTISRRILGSLVTESWLEEYNVGMNIFINAQVEVVLPPFSPRWFFAGCKWGKLEGGRYATQDEKQPQNQTPSHPTAKKVNTRRAQTLVANPR